MDSPLPPSALPPRRRVEGSSTEHKQQLEREVSSALDLTPFQLANQGKASATEVSRQNRKMQPHMQSQVEVRLRLRLRLRLRVRAGVRLRLRLRLRLRARAGVRPTIARMSLAESAVSEARVAIFARIASLVSILEELPALL